MIALDVDALGQTVGFVVNDSGLIQKISLWDSGAWTTTDVHYHDHANDVDVYLV